jgi:hypothetical protein
MGPILIKIDLSKLDKDLFFVGKNGKVADLVLWPDKEGKYGKDFALQQSVSREQRAAGKRGPYCGDGIFMNKDERGKNKVPQAGEQVASSTTAGEAPIADDCPF